MEFNSGFKGLNVFKSFQSFFRILAFKLSRVIDIDLYEFPHKKFDVGQIWRSWRSGIDHPRPNHRSGNVDTCLWIRGDAKLCWKSMFCFPSSDWVIKCNSNTRRWKIQVTTFTSLWRGNVRIVYQNLDSPTFYLLPVRYVFHLRWNFQHLQTKNRRPSNRFVTGMLAVAGCWNTLTSAQLFWPSCDLA